MSDWEDWGKSKNNNPPSGIAVPVKYPSDAAMTKRWMSMGDHYMGTYSVLPCTPDLPTGYYRAPATTTTTTINNNTTTTVVSTKTADTSIFADTFFLASPDYKIEALLSLKSLTGNEILQVAHRQNFYTNSAVLNSNILDIVDSINFYSPTQIIKLQKPDLSYFKNNLGAYRLSLTSSIVTINIPSTGIDQSFKVEIETFAPNLIKNDTIY